jgi:hypothetical protein
MEQVEEGMEAMDLSFTFTFFCIHCRLIIKSAVTTETQKGHSPRRRWHAPITLAFQQQIGLTIGKRQATHTTGNSTTRRRKRPLGFWVWTLRLENKNQEDASGCKKDFPKRQFR